MLCLVNVSSLKLALFFYAAPVLGVENCKKDKLATWACEILTDKHFCSNKKDVLKCCETCRRKMKYFRNKISVNTA